MLLDSIKNASIGNAQVKELYIGSKLIWQSTWTPSQIPTLFWYDASDTSTITATGNIISQVNDKSGNGYNLTVKGGQTGPSTGTRTLNGLNVIEYDGVAGCLENFSFAYNQFASPLNIALVVQADTSGSGLQYFLLAGTPSTTNSQRQSIRRTTTDGWQIIGGNGSTYNTISCGPSPGGAPQIVLPTFNGANTKWRTNGTQTGSGNCLTNAFSIFTLGHNEGENFDWDGFYAEIIAFSDNTKQQIVEGYLAWKWGLQGNLPVGHPYKSSAP